MNIAVKNILNNLAKKYNISKAQSEEIYSKQFELVRRVIGMGDSKNPDTFKSIRLPQFGKFVFHKKKWEKINEMNPKNKNNDDKECV